MKNNYELERRNIFLRNKEAVRGGDKGCGAK